MLSSSQIGAVLRQARQTFGSMNKLPADAFQNHLTLLRKTLSGTTASDVGFNEAKYMSAEHWQRPHQAPVTYIEIFEDDCVSMGIFVISPGMKLPLHDHPQMYGLLRVIAGTVKIHSYTLQDGHRNNYMRHKFSDSDVDGEASEKGPTTPLLLKARRLPVAAINAESDCCLLQPVHGNLHEIESDGGTAAFIDVLSPPYRTSFDLSDTKVVRHCTFFQLLDIPQATKPCAQVDGAAIAHSQQDDSVVVTPIPAPTWYWADSDPYMGPQLHIDQLQGLSHETKQEQ